MQRSSERQAVLLDERREIRRLRAPRVAPPRGQPRRRARRPRPPLAAMRDDPGRSGPSSLPPSGLPAVAAFAAMLAWRAAAGAARAHADGAVRGGEGQLSRSAGESLGQREGTWWLRQNQLTVEGRGRRTHQQPLRALPAIRTSSARRCSRRPHQQAATDCDVSMAIPRKPSIGEGLHQDGTHRLMRPERNEAVMAQILHAAQHLLVLQRAWAGVADLALASTRLDPPVGGRAEDQADTGAVIGDHADRLQRCTGHVARPTPPALIPEGLDRRRRTVVVMPAPRPRRVGPNGRPAGSSASRCMSCSAVKAPISSAAAHAPRPSMRRFRCRASRRSPAAPPLAQHLAGGGLRDAERLRRRRSHCPVP